MSCCLIILTLLNALDWIVLVCSKHYMSLCLCAVVYVLSQAVKDVYILARIEYCYILWRTVCQACGMKVEFSASQNNKAKSQMKWDLTIFLHNNLMCQLSQPCSMSTMFWKVQAQHYKLLVCVSNAISATIPEFPGQMSFWTTKLRGPALVSGCLPLGNYNNVEMRKEGQIKK